MRVLLLLFLALVALPSWSEPARNPQRLKSLSLEQLGNIEVTTVSKQPEEVWRTPAAIYVLTQADIRRSGATTLPELLRMIPGVQVSRMQSDQWAVGVRGLASQFSRGLLVMIDGRSVYTPLFEGVYWNVQSVLTPPRSIESDQDYRFLSRLPAQHVRSYQTMDAHLGWTVRNHVPLAVNGRDLLQPFHHEFTGDNGNAVGIRRRLYASLAWRP